MPIPPGFSTVAAGRQPEARLPASKIPSPYAVASQARRKLHPDPLRHGEPEGWSANTRGARSVADLPAAAVRYVKRLEELVGAPVALLSTSPDRNDAILMRDPLAD